MKVEKIVIAPGEGTPNSANPMIIYRGALEPATSLEQDIARASEFLARNGWAIAWYTDKGLHPFHHFHTNAHEIVWVARGSQRGTFGGPDGIDATVRAGDLIVLPAGTGHIGLEKTDDLYMIGGYPAGTARGNVVRSDESIGLSFANEIAGIPVPTDPLTGKDGVLTESWHSPLLLGPL